MLVHVEPPSVEYSILRDDCAAPSDDALCVHAKRIGLDASTPPDGVRFVGALGGVFNVKALDSVTAEDSVPCVPAVVCTVARYWVVPLVRADVSSHVVVPVADKEDIANVVFEFHVEPPSLLSWMTTWEDR